MVTKNGKLLSEGDFTTHIDESYLQHTDEVGKLSKTFEILTDNMRNMLHQVNDSALQVEQAVNDVTNRTEETAQIAEETNTIVSNVATAAEIQLESAKDSAIAMQEMATGTVRIAEIATDVSESSNEIHQQTNSGGKLLNLSVSQMQNIQEGTHIAVETVENSQKDVNQGKQFMKDLQTDFQAMFNYLDQIDEQMNDLSALAEEMSAGTVEISSAVDETLETTTRTTENIRAAEDKINTQSTMVQDIQASTRSLEETANALKQSIAHFKV